MRERHSNLCRTTIEIHGQPNSTLSNSTPQSLYSDPLKYALYYQPPCDILSNP